MADLKEIRDRWQGLEERNFARLSQRTGVDYQRLWHGLHGSTKLSEQEVSIVEAYLLVEEQTQELRKQLDKTLDARR